MKKIIILLSLSLSFCAVAEDRYWVSCIECQTGQCKSVRTSDIRHTQPDGKYIDLIGYGFEGLLVSCNPDTIQYGLICDKHSEEEIMRCNRRYRTIGDYFRDKSLEKDESPKQE